MEHALNKLDLYHFFGSLLPGIVVVMVAYGTGTVTMGYVENEALQVLIFLVASYLAGSVIREIASFLDEESRTFFHFRAKASSDFLNPGGNERNWVVTNPQELTRFQAMARDILAGEHPEQSRAHADGTCFSKEECSEVFQYCKTRLEAEGRMEKADRINAEYAMYRSLMVAALPCFLMIVWVLPAESGPMERGVLLCAMVLLEALFYRKYRRYAAYRVRVILRQYAAWLQERGEKEEIARTTAGEV